MKQKSIVVLDAEIRILDVGDNTEFLSLSDMARKFGNPKDIIANWIRNRSSISFMRVWEKIHNPEFKEEPALVFEFNAGTPSFSVSPSKWIAETNAIGIWVKQGRGGAVYAHEDLALEFGMYLSPEFKVYLVNEFKRLKRQEQEKLGADWKFKRELSKIFYRVHTDTIEEYLIPPEIRKSGLDGSIYANEANILNKALFGMTASEWRKKNPEKEGNMRDWATPAQLVMLSMLESQNAFLISKGVSAEDRLQMLNETARKHMKSILSKPNNLGKLLKMSQDNKGKLKG